MNKIATTDRKLIEDIDMFKAYTMYETEYFYNITHLSLRTFPTLTGSLMDLSHNWTIDLLLTDSVIIVVIEKALEMEFPGVYSVTSSKTTTIWRNIIQKYRLNIWLIAMQIIYGWEMSPYTSYGDIKLDQPPICNKC